MGPSLFVGSILNILKEQLIETFFSLAVKRFLTDLPDGRLVYLGVFAPGVVQYSLNC